MSATDLHQAVARALVPLTRLITAASGASFTDEEIDALAEDAITPLSELVWLADGRVTITVHGDGVLVSGRLPRGDRELHRASVAMARALARVGLEELEVLSELDRPSLVALARSIGRAASSQGLPERVSQPPAGIVLHSAVRPQSIAGRREGDGPRFLRTYAAAVSAVRRCHQAFAQGRPRLTSPVKRVALRLATLTTSRLPTTRGVATLAAVHRDLPSRAVQTAIIALLAARQATDDATFLIDLAMLALVGDAGTLWLTGQLDPAAAGKQAPAAEVPAGTAALLIAASGAGATSRRRAVAAFEAVWLDHGAELGAPPGGTLGPLGSAHLLHATRAFLDLVGPPDGRAALSLPDALVALSTRGDIDALALRALVAALGPLPVGTAVELLRGQWGVVIGESLRGDAFERPRVALVLDEEGRPYPQPLVIDLGMSDSAGIARIVGPELARFNVARALYG